MNATATVPPYVKPAQFARERGLAVNQVLAWIHAGELKAVNYALNANGLRPRWRIPPESVRDFDLRRMNRRPPLSVRRRRATAVKDYF